MRRTNVTLAGLAALLALWAAFLLSQRHPLVAVGSVAQRGAAESAADTAARASSEPAAQTPSAWPATAIASWAEVLEGELEPVTGLPARVRRRSDGALMTLVPPGEFTLGDERGEGSKSERPARRVRISRPFYMDVYQVTWEQFRRFSESTGWRMPPAPPWGIQENHPVVNVAWMDAASYSRWAGGRLPAEAEWEYAAKGGAEGRRYPWGDEYRPGMANDLSSGLEETTPVGSYPQGVSRWGSHDLAGNVWEWCADGFVFDGYSRIEEGAVDPRGPEEATARNLRGGSFLMDEKNVRTSARQWISPINCTRNIGFRVVVGLE
jgi:sulfatase modifying factor 1